MASRRADVSARDVFGAYATRERSSPPSFRMPPEADDDVDDDPLSAMIGEIVRDFHADGVLITHQHEAGTPVVLFSDGACDAAGDAGEATLLNPAAEPSSEWCAMAGAPEGAILTTRLPTRRGAIVVRTFFGRMGDTTRARARVASARLQPLLSPLARLWWQRRHARARVRDLTAAIDRTDVGVILVDAQGQPTFTNSAAATLLADGDGLRLAGAMLGGNALADTLRLQAAIEHVVRAGETAAEPAPVIALPRAHRRPLMVAVMAARREEDGDAVGGAIDHAGILYVFDPEQDLCTLIEPACALYGLSPVEARLTCLLADGMSLAQAAGKMRVREMTARSYLKQIFLKTDTNRQAELVWLMLKSTVRTRTGPRAGIAATLI